MNKQGTIERSIGLAGATGVGIGAIVGGGILALAGVAYATTGPATLLVFAANGVIAVLTALSFAEMSTAFPQSGGTYTFAKNVLSVRAAFAFGTAMNPPASSARILTMACSSASAPAATGCR